MTWLRYFRRRRRDRELATELEAHLAHEASLNLARGMSAEEARLAAIRKLGNITTVKEAVHEMSTLVTIESLWRDLRFAARQLRLNPGFTLVAILSLAFGIGANTAIFQLLNAVRLRSLPIARPHELAQVRIEGLGGFGVQTGLNSDLTNPLWEQIRQHQEAFSGIFAWGTANFQVGQGAQARRVSSIWVSGDLFSVLGVSPVRGRLFHAADDRRGCGPEGAVISYAFWQREFGGEDSAIGQALVINDRSYPIIGVTPPEFFGLEVGRSFEVALPVCARAGALDRRDFFWLTVMGRLKPGWTMAQAAEQMKAISPGIFEATIPPACCCSLIIRTPANSLAILACPAESAP